MQVSNDDISYCSAQLPKGRFWGPKEELDQCRETKRSALDKSVLHQRTRRFPIKPTHIVTQENQHAVQQTHGTHSHPNPSVGWNLQLPWGFAQRSSITTQKGDAISDILKMTIQSLA